MKESGEIGDYRMELPESADWSLLDLYTFPHAFDQCYAFIYCFDTNLPERDRDRINDAIESYPWKGGYSYVNIYTVLQHQIPRPARPKIKSIHKASPGWLEVSLNLEAAVTVAKSVGIIVSSGVGVLVAYNLAMKILSNIRLHKRRAQVEYYQLNAQEIQAVIESCEGLARAMGFRSLQQLHERTRNPEVSLKLLAAHYRRMKTLVDYVRKEKVQLPSPPED
jgi:hypothetical protein